MTDPRPHRTGQALTGEPRCRSRPQDATPSSMAASPQTSTPGAGHDDLDTSQGSCATAMDDSTTGNSVDEASMEGLSFGVFRDREERERERESKLIDGAPAAADALCSDQRYVGTGPVQPPGEEELPLPPLACKVAACNKTLKGEDTWFSEIVSTSSGSQYHCAGVFDGHGGRAAAEYCRDNMASYLTGAAAQTPGGGQSLAEMAVALKLVFARCHRELRETPGLTAGTTATVIVVDHAHRRVLCANVGDSSAMVCDATTMGFVSADHRLHSNKDEQNRVLSLGSKLAYARHPGTNQPAGPLRMWPGGLAVSRSLGDADCGAALSCEPHLEIFSLPRRGAVILVCSDGVWDSLGMYESACLARGSNDPEAIGRRVVKTAIQNRGLRDDTTCIVMRIGKGLARRGQKSKLGDDDGSADSSSVIATTPSGRCAFCTQSMPLAMLRALCGGTMGTRVTDEADATIKGGTSHSVHG